MTPAQLSSGIAQVGVSVLSRISGGPAVTGCGSLALLHSSPHDAVAQPQLLSPVGRLFYELLLHSATAGLPDIYIYIYIPITVSSRHTYAGTQDSFTVIIALANPSLALLLTHTLSLSHPVLGLVSLCTGMRMSLMVSLCLNLSV